MPKKFYSHELNRVLEVPDDFTVEQVMAWEDELRGDRGILNKAAGFTRGLLPGAIQGAAGMVEGVGGMTSSDTIKGIAGLMRDNPVSKYLIERPIQDEGNVGRTAGELAGNIATMFTPGAAARVAGAAPRVARGLSTLAGVAQSAGEATGEVRRNREQGMDVTPGEEMSAAWKAAPLGLLDAAVPTRLLSRIDDFGGRDLAKKGLASLLGRSAVTGGIEGATETAQQLGLNLVERGYNPNQAINEGLLESAQAGGAAGMAIDMGLSILGRRIARKGARNIERAMGESPQIPDDGIAGIGIRRDAQGEADVRAMRGRVEPPPTAEPTPRWSEDRAPFLDAASKAIFDRPLSELDALTAINLDREVERVRNQYQETDESFLNTLQNMAPVGPKPDPRRSWAPGLDNMVARAMGDDPTGMMPTAPVVPPPLDENYQAPPPPPPNFSHSVDPTAESPIYSLANTEAPQAYTVDALSKEVEAGTKPQIALDLFSELKRLKMDDLVSTKIVDAMSTKDGNKAHGSYANKIITLSLESADKAKLIQTLNHEAVHAMKKIGMFTDTEWNVLQAALDPSVMMSDEERRVYGEYFKGDTTRMREEAIARGIEGYVAGTLKLPEPATGIIAKAVNALDAIGIATRKQTAADVIKAQQFGAIGERYVPDAENPAIPAMQAKENPAKPVDTGEAIDTELLDELPDDDTEASFSIFSPQDQSQYDRLFGKQDKRGFLQKLKETYEDYRKPQKQTIDSFGMRARQQGLDKRAGIEKLSDQSENKTADVSAIAATRFADNAGNVAVAALTKGRLELVGTAGNGYFQASAKNDGLFRKDGQLAKLQKDGKLEATFWAAGAERAAELMAEGKEKLYTPADIARGKQFLKDPEIAAGVSELKGHFDSLIDALQSSGMITPQSASKMKAKAYFPFYRIMEDKDGNIVATGPRGFQETLVQAPPGGGLGLGNLAALHKLKGGENPINDPVENIARNTFALTSLAMRNVAAQRVMRDGKALGYVKQVASDKSAPDTVKVWINGKPRYFAVLDKVLYDSVQASGIEVGSLMKVIGVGPAKFLRDMVTSDPVFMVRNAMRDSTQLWMQGYSAAPFTNIVGGLRKALTNAESYDTLQRMGVIGTGVRGEGIDETASNLRGELGDKGLATRAIDRKNKVLAGSEAIGRITVYDSVRNRGGSPAQAAYEALELLNFGRKGSSPFVQWVTALTPFLNAHAQGTDVIYRTMRGKGVGGAKQQRQLAMRGLALSALTALYAIMSQGEEYYENATGEEKDLYWFVPIPGSKEAFKIPTPFELAIPFKILPEHMVNLTLGKEIPDDAWKAAKRAVSSVFGIQPPQTIKPILEGTTNYDLFRQRAIEPESMKRLEPSMRYDDYTAELSKSLGQATNLSPLQIDHLIKGYTGSMGTLALNIMDAVLEYGTSPEARFNQPSTIPAVGRMFQREDGGKMLVDFYELRDIAEQAVATQRAMAKQGMVDSPAGQQKRAQRVAVAKATEKMDNQIAVQRRLRKKIMSLPESEITPAQKRDALNEIRRREIEITRPAQNLRRAVQ